MTKSSKMLQFINYRMRVTIQDGRQLVGKFMAFDRHMNLVLGDCEEFHKLPPAKGKKTNEEREDRRTLGMVLLRGEEVVSMTIEGPPPQEESRAKASSAAAMAGRGEAWWRRSRVMEFDFPHQYLNLALNYLTGPLSAAIANLTGLQYFSVGINDLSGELPKELGQLTELRSLAIGGNNFSGSLPSELGNLSKLQHLHEQVMFEKFLVVLSEGHFERRFRFKNENEHV